MKACSRGVILIGINSLIQTSHAFVNRGAFSRSGFRSGSGSIQPFRMSSESASFQIPTVEQLLNDPFMAQVSHSEKLVTLLKEDSRVLAQEEVVARLKAQLSHSDGIRGFFVTYLTGVGDDTPADQSSIPQALVAAMEVADLSELIPLACMNVIMPTGMITMHQDPELSAQSKKTADRGIRFLASMKTDAEVQKTCEAIIAVATNSQGQEVSNESFEFWTKFFKNWGYEDAQKVDIATAIRSVLKE